MAAVRSRAASAATRSRTSDRDAHRHRRLRLHGPDALRKLEANPRREGRRDLRREPRPAEDRRGREPRGRGHVHGLHGRRRLRRLRADARRGRFRRRRPHAADVPAPRPLRRRAEGRLPRALRKAHGVVDGGLRRDARGRAPREADASRRAVPALLARVRRAAEADPLRKVRPGRRRRVPPFVQSARGEGRTRLVPRREAVRRLSAGPAHPRRGHDPVPVREAAGRGRPDAPPRGWRPRPRASRL